LAAAIRPATNATTALSSRQPLVTINNANAGFWPAVLTNRTW
jgi:hypothetical protein